MAQAAPSKLETAVRLQCAPPGCSRVAFSSPGCSAAAGAPGARPPCETRGTGRNQAEPGLSRGASRSAPNPSTRAHSPLSTSSVPQGTVVPDDEGELESHTRAAGIRRSAPLKVANSPPRSRSLRARNLQRSGCPRRPYTIMYMAKACYLSFVIDGNPSSWVARYKLTPTSAFAWLPVEKGSRWTLKQFGKQGGPSPSTRQIPDVDSFHRTYHSGSKINVHDSVERLPANKDIIWTDLNVPCGKGWKAAFGAKPFIRLCSWPVFLCPECRNGRQVADHPPATCFQSERLSADQFDGRYAIELNCHLAYQADVEECVDRMSTFIEDGQKMRWVLTQPTVAMVITPSLPVEGPLLESARKAHGWCKHVPYVP